MRKRTCGAAALLILAGSIQSLKSLPWASYWGLDFQNLWVFQHCAQSAQPYGIAGAACGDALGRGMFYPPLLYNAFAWARLFADFRWAYALWAVAVVGTLVLSFAYWGRGACTDSAERLFRHRISLAFLALVLLQYPSVFALERGNSDVGAVLLWSASAALWMRGRRGASGFAGGLAVAFKLYPVFAVAVIGAGLLSSARAGVRWVLGAATAVALSVAVFAEQSRVYFLEVLPRFAGTLNLPSLANHSLSSRLAPGPRYAVFALLLGTWAYRSFKSLRTDPRLVFAGALALSTYFAGVSEDYNLVTAYPLLFLQWSRGMSEGVSEGDPKGRLYRALALAGIVSLFGHRQIFVGSSAYFQVAWLVAAAVLARDGTRQMSSMSPRYA